MVYETGETEELCTDELICDGIMSVGWVPAGSRPESAGQLSIAGESSLILQLVILHEHVLLSSQVSHRHKAGLEQVARSPCFSPPIGLTSMLEFFTLLC